MKTFLAAFLLTFSTTVFAGGFSQWVPPGGGGGGGIVLTGGLSVLTPLYITIGTDTNANWTLSITTNNIMSFTSFQVTKHMVDA